MHAKRFSAVFPDVGIGGQQGGFDLRFRQLDPGPQTNHGQFVIGKHISLIGMQYDRGFHQVGLSPQGFISFGVPIRGFRSWFNRTYAHDSLLPFNHETGLDGISLPGFQAITFTVTKARIYEIAELCHAPMPDYFERPTDSSIVRDSAATQAFRQMLTKVVFDGSMPFDEEMQDELIVSLLRAALSDSGIEDKSQPVTRSRATSAALALIREDQTRSLTVREICAKTGVSWATLERAFKERFGYGPKAYLIRQRLSAARKEFLKGHPDTGITETAGKNGFWHMGQFSKDYKKHFGELPSDTLRWGTKNRGKFGSLIGPP